MDESILGIEIVDGVEARSKPWLFSRLGPPLQSTSVVSRSLWTTTGLTSRLDGRGGVTTAGFADILWSKDTFYLFRRICKFLVEVQSKSGEDLQGVLRQVRI